MTEKKKSFKIFTAICLIIAAFVIAIQMVNFTSTFARLRFGLILQFVPDTLRSATLMFVPLVFGAVYGKKKKAEMAEVFRFWLTSVVTLIIFYLGYFIVHPHSFNMWRMWGVFFPVATGTSVILSTLVFGLLAKPAIAKLQAKMSEKQNLLILSFLTLAGFTLSAGTLQFNYSIFGLYLVLYFAWGMYLSQIHFSKKVTTWLIILGIISFFVVLVGVPGFSGIYWYHLRSGDVYNWNREFLSNPSSPFMFLIIQAALLIFKPVINDLSRRQLRDMIPVIVLMQTTLSSHFAKSFRFTNSAGLNKFIFFTIVVAATFILAKLYEKYLFRGKLTKRIISYLSQSSNLVLVLEDAWNHLVSWAIRNKVTLLTWAWFYVIGFASFIIETDGMRIRFMTSNDINAIIFILGNRFFALILTAIFLYAIFTIFYFITTRYWLSNILVSTIIIGWAIANKVKLDLRGEPIYPSELSEAVNAKSLLGMVNPHTVIAIVIGLVVIIALTIFLEVKFPIKKKGSWKHRGIWALLSLILLITPARFNHEDNIIYFIKRGFDNKAFFRNPEREIQINGPLLNFMNYIDLQVMDQPSNYSEQNVDRVISKYQKVAKDINKGRKNDLKDQTVIFNLSESFVDPYTFPTIKFAKGLPNPVSYIQSLKDKATYGSMISAGYGGGTANMEWESLTGFNMGFFKTTLTPYVQIVPHYNFYPTIGMNFKTATAIHPYIGTYYSRVEDYNRFKFNRFIYLGSKWKIINQKHIDRSPYNSDFTAYDNAVKQLNDDKNGQFINLISMQNHMPYSNWYKNNEYMGKISGQLFSNGDIRSQMATYVKGVQYTDKAVKKFIAEIDKMKKPVTFVFYGDHYPSILPQNLITKYPVQMHATRYFIYSNKYAREHGAKARLTSKYKYVNTSDFIAMMLKQTNTKVTPYQALLTEIHRQLPAITINFDEEKGFQLVNQKGTLVDPTDLTNEQQALIKDFETIQYDMTAGKGYALKSSNFYK